MRGIRIAAVMLLFTLFGFNYGTAAIHAAESLASGEYTVNYTVLRAEDDSVSIANDYFDKPAKLQVKDGTNTLQVKINHSAWMTQFNIPSGGSYTAAKVVSTDTAEDTRIVQFAVSDLSTPFAVRIHVTIDSISYDHDYTIRFAFEPDKATVVKLAPTAGAAQGSTPAAEQSGAGNSSSAGGSASAPVQLSDGKKDQPKATADPKAGQSAAGSKQEPAKAAGSVGSSVPSNSSSPAPSVAAVKGDSNSAVAASGAQQGAAQSPQPSASSQPAEPSASPASSDPNNVAAGQETVPDETPAPLGTEGSSEVSAAPDAEVSEEAVVDTSVSSGADAAGELTVSKTSSHNSNKIVLAILMIFVVLGAAGIWWNSRKRRMNSRPGKGTPQ